MKTASAALAASVLPGLACRPAERRAAAPPKKALRILQWSHFVPGYDRWFDGVYTKQWGERHGTQVIVDHIAPTEINARGAAEASAQKGHDLFLFQSPPAAYAAQVLDLRDVVREVERRHGKMIELAERSTLDPKTGKSFAFSDSYVPDPGNYRIDLWSEAGYPKGPDSWEDLRVGGRKIKEKFGNPVGLGLSQETDSNMALRALLWSFGGAETDVDGRVVLNSKETVDALEFARALYRETETAEVFTWDPASNNRAMLAGRISYAQNAISITRTAEKENPEIARKIGLTTALRGPVRRIAAEHLMNCYVIWKFAENPDGAKQFLVDLMDDFGSVFRESEFYNFPCFPATVPDLAGELAGDPKADPRGKYSALATVLDWTTNVGYPGYATPATDEVFSTFVIPTMFARVARGDTPAETAAADAQKETERIFAKWRKT
ncbi:MAG TPA: extracellular solute-binding protein [Thermoanaerobaculia bacterium]|nr:extracellular solute-binding protein [Thermoanaerobaculia bacterium]